MMDVAEFETFKNFTILYKALLFLIKLSKTALQTVLFEILLQKNLNYQPPANLIVAMVVAGVAGSGSSSQSSASFLRKFRNNFTNLSCLI